MRIGLVGAGWWAREVHAPAFHGAGAQIQGVYAQGSPRARALAEAYGAKVYEDYGELLENVDAVAIATPDAAHVPLALEAVRRGRHVFLEKPVGLSLEEARSLLQEAEARGVVGWVPQLGPHEGFGAMQIHSLHPDPYHQDRCASRIGKLLER